MSHLALQRVMVRMLYDPQFASRVLLNPAAALPGEPLTEEERAWLLRPDPRAWRTDPERPLRSLTALLQEYPASAALAVASGGSANAIRRFFSSAPFHRVIQERGSMALAFGDHLVDLVQSGEAPDARVAPLARLEQAIARLRRRSWNEGFAITPQGEPQFRLSPDKATFEAEAGTADLHDQIRDALPTTGPDLACAVLEPGAPMPATPLDPSCREPLILELIRDEGPRVKSAVGVAEITPELFAILSFASSPRPRADLEAEAVRLGADPEEAPGIVEEWITEGLIVTR